MLTKRRRSFTDEVKREAVALLASNGRPLMPIVEDLGIQLSMPRRWRTAAGGLRGFRARRAPASGADDLTIAALTLAIQRQRPARGLIHPSDRGSQRAAGDDCALLKASDIVLSMSRKGNGWERTVSRHRFEWRRERADGESRFHTLKTEGVPHARYTSRDEARRDLFADIKTDNNRQRLHAAPR